MRIAAMCCVLVWSASVSAAIPDRVVVVSSGQEGVYADIQDAIYRELNRVGIDPARRSTAQAGTWSAGEQDAQTGRLVVTIGLDAAEKAPAPTTNAPVYVALVPELSYRVLRAAQSRPAPAVFYLDQPLERQMALIRYALPSAKRVAVVLGPESSVLRERVQRAAESAGLAIRIERAERPEDLNGAVTRALVDSEILLAIPDEQVFNRNTAHNVLLTAYRLRKPVAGYSQAYVKAGALFAVYSTPSQIGRQIGLNVARLLGPSHEALPPMQYPREYEVMTNERVARSLGIVLAPAERLTARLREGGQ